MAATIKDVARTAGVSTATVSAVINESAYVSPALRARVLEAVRDLSYAPSQLARRLRTGASELIAIVVADLSNPFYARVVCAAEAAVVAWGFSLVVFNSDEKPEAEKRIISRVRALCCDGLILVPVGGAVSALGRDADSRRIPTVLFGRTLEDDGLDAVTIDNFTASYRATNYLIDLGHKRIGAITGPRRLSTGLDRIEGMQSAMSANGLTFEPRFVRSGEFREEVAYSAARAMLEQPERPTALYVANGLMALGVMRAIADIGLKMPRGCLGRLDRQHSGHQGSQAQSHAHRASDRRHGERSCAAARRSHETRRRGRGAPCRLSLGAHRRRQLRPAERVKISAADRGHCCGAAKARMGSIDD